MGDCGRLSHLSPPSVEDLYAQYPRLRASGHRITSPFDDEYNCVAWIERAFTSWVEPGIQWPPGVPTPLGSSDLDCYIALFRLWGFEDAESPDLEPGFLKIAIYANGQEFEHVAKQLPSGAWSSKGGNLCDFRHEQLEALNNCGVMKNATVVKYMRRRYDGSDSMELEENGLLRP